MKTINISGMGSGYENVCQQILKNGLDWLEKNPEKAKELPGSYKAFQGVFGVTTPETEIAKQFDESLMTGIEDATGAMHHACVGHLLFIAKNGKDKWLAEATEGDPERAFEWDGSVESCPKGPVD